MQSRTWCFNRTLFCKNLSRFWPLWAMASLLAMLPPVMLAVELMRRRGHLEINALWITDSCYSAVGMLVPPVLLVYAVVCAMAVWSYLFHSRSVGLMHALPVSRRGLFLTNFLSGFVMVLIPFAVCGALCVVVTAAFGLLDPVGLGVTVLCSLGLALFYFASATVCAFLTGNAFAMPVFYFVFHFLAVTLELLLSSLANLCLFGLAGSYAGAVEWLSPTVWLNEHLSVERTWTEVTQTLPHGTVTENVLAGVQLNNAWAVGLYALAGVVLLLCGWLLYRRRASECAGDVVAVGWMRPFFRYGVAALASLAGGQGLYFLFWYDWSGWSAARLGACMFLTGVIGYYIASMLLARSLRVFRGSWRGPVAVAAAAAAVCLCLQTDLLGIERRVPELASVETVEVYLDGNTYDLEPRLRPELTERTLELHRAVIADRDYVRRWQQEVWTAEQSQEELEYTASWLTLHYTLTNGTEFFRQYNLPITPQRLEQPDTYDALLTSLAADREMKLLRLHMDAAGALTDGWEADSVWVNSEVDGTAVSGGSREMQTVLSALAADIDAGAWGDPDWFGDDWGQVYALNVELSFCRDAAPEDRDRDYAIIILRPEMTHTVAALLQCRLVSEEDLITQDQWEQAAAGSADVTEYAVRSIRADAPAARAADLAVRTELPTVEPLRFERIAAALPPRTLVKLEAVS